MRSALLFILIVCASFWSLIKQVGSTRESTNGSHAAGSVPSRSINSNNTFINYTVDYIPFREAMVSALKKSGDLSLAPCFIPDKAIMFTISDYHMFPLLRLRHKIMNQTNLISCQQQRFITVCVDKRCMSLCEYHGILNCVRLLLPEAKLREPKRENDIYLRHLINYIVWMKYEIFAEALIVANEVFYLDADVILFGNPFPDTLFGRNQTGHNIPGPYDIMYQRERGINELGCGGSVNTGLLYLRNSTGIRERFLPAIVKHRTDIITRSLGGRAEQDIVSDYVRLVNYCTLPVSKFVGFCLPSQDARGYDPKKVVTFHTNCVTGTHNKVERVRNFAHAYFGRSV